MGIEHIGSTSVSGLGAKTIIDIMAGVEDLAQQFKYDRLAYTEAKGSFIRQVIQQAKLRKDEKYDAGYTSNAGWFKRTNDAVIGAGKGGRYLLYMEGSWRYGMAYGQREHS
ncbi:MULTISPECIES: GrpB family protein [unclassified Paenibacillus]|uniref:GrpB family protein n=1 Tax=unclassified Paenibacillus TaxID=185978 RepID=UPI003834F504